MAKKKRHRGHYCKVCGRILPNEKFSGKGHAAHICKKCARKQKEQQSEELALNRIYHVYHDQNLSRDNRRMLEQYTHSKRERIRSAALEAIATFRKPLLSDGIEYSEAEFLDEA
jgi:methionyl-tRNA synthetase